MKKLVTLLFVAMLGGGISLSAYHFFVKKEKTILSNQQPAQYMSVSYTPKNAAKLNTDFTTAVENSIHAVVHIKNKTVTNVPNSFFYGYREKTHIGTGSGVIISPDGYIVTNNHVIADATEIEVTMNSNKTYSASLVGTDSSSDIALLKVEVDENLPYIVFGDSNNAKIGEWVLAVGNPFNLTSTVTAGIISAKSRDLNELDNRNQYFLQTDAAVNPGNSGGALVNIRGELIGINTAITSQTGAYIGYSFAIPSNTAKKVIEDLLEYGTVHKGLLGISTLNRNSKQAKDIGLDEIEGVYVAAVDPNSGAKKAGLKPGDIIKKLDRVKINKFSDLTGFLSGKGPNQKVQVTVERDNELKTFTVSLSSNDDLADFGTLQFAGMELNNINKKLKERVGIDNGVMVIKNENSNLYQYGLQPGAIIIEVNNQPIKNIKQLKGFDSNNLKSIVYITNNGTRERLIFD